MSEFDIKNHERPYIVSFGKAYGTLTHKEYIDHWLWKEKREWILKIRDWTCETCGRRKKDKYAWSNYRDEWVFLKKGEPKLILQVHHLHYRSMGNESSKDVEVLCKGCHQQFHNIQNER
tara:strand:- start:2144 stop:2500 length:357 start_codon:yes stop_codon:yes gene_type:complete